MQGEADDLKLAQRMVSLFKELDLTGDAANPDPVCTLTPLRTIIDRAVQDAAAPAAYRYRYISLAHERA